jgi:hypothetical protein
MTYVPDQMLRNLEPQRMTKAQQRDVDEHLGAAIAAISRRTGRIVQLVHVWDRQTANAERETKSFRKPADQSASSRRSGADEEHDNFAHALRK